MTSATVCYGIHPWEDTTLTDAFYREPLEIDVTAFHIYACEWTPKHMGETRPKRSRFWQDGSYEPGSAAAERQAVGPHQASSPNVSNRHCRASRAIALEMVCFKQSCSY